MKFLFAFTAVFFLQMGFSQEIDKKTLQPNELATPTKLNEFKLEETTVLSTEGDDKVKKMKKGELIETKDERLDLLIQDYTENKKTIGYRVQLFSGSSRWEAIKVKSDFLKKYKEVNPPHLVYQSPNFKIRVGDYKDRLEAQKYLELYKVDYPSAFIVKDEIEFIAIE